MLIPAVKTWNLYLLEKDQYNKLLRENLTKHYKSANIHLYNNIYTEAKTIAEKLKIKDWRPNGDHGQKRSLHNTQRPQREFRKHPSMPVDKPRKKQNGQCRQKILDNINKVRSKTDVNLWKNLALFAN